MSKVSHGRLPLASRGTQEEVAPEHSASEGLSVDTPSDLASEWLFNASVEPMLIVESSGGRIVTANAAVGQLLQIPRQRLSEMSLSEAFEPSSRAALDAALLRASATGRASVTDARALHFGRVCGAAMSLVRVEGQRYLLVKLSSPQWRAAPGSDRPSMVWDAIESTCVGFAITDRNFCIEYANAAFQGLIDVGSLSEIRGEALTAWLNFTPHDLRHLSEQMRQRGAVSEFAVCSAPGLRNVREFEVCAVAVPDGPHPCWGFSLRPRPALN
jgi:nitrogen-specific signal transduction histidine kinase